MFKVIAAIIAIADIFKIAKSFLDLLTEKWIDKKILDIDDVIVDHQKKRDVILNQMSKASTNEERKILSLIHADYINGRVSDSDS